ncbi:MAG TPA: cupredoxin domain-containing protein [Miltoncostaea sp.]|jgi:plastocyanin|nr:cupredoxin domain-containing protein [Miltoncostaea sp.]
MGNRRIVISAAAATLAAAALAAATGGAATAPAGTKANPIRAKANASAGFTPRRITARPGARVFFKNVDHLTHNAAEDVLSGTPRFTSGQPTTRNFSFVAPRKPGTYVFHCQIHGFMHGTLVVRK